MLAAGSDASGMTLRIRLVDDGGDNWTEGGINYGNRPTGQGLEILVDGNQLLAGQLSVDVTTLLTQGFNANGLATFHIDVVSSPGAARWVSFASSEASDTAAHPSLTVASSS